LAHQSIGDHGIWHAAKFQLDPPTPLAARASETSLLSSRWRGLSPSRVKLVLSERLDRRSIYRFLGPIGPSLQGNLQVPPGCQILETGRRHEIKLVMDRGRFLPPHSSFSLSRFSILASPQAFPFFHAKISLFFPASGNPSGLGNPGF